MSKKKYWKAQAEEAQRAAYLYSVKNGVGKNEAMACVTKARNEGVSPSTITPKSQASTTSCGSALAYGTSSSSSTSSSKTSSSSSSSNSSNSTSTSSSNSSTSTESLSSVLTSDNIKALFAEILNVLKNIFAPNAQNQYVNNGQPPKGVDPNQYAKQYANANNLTLEQAKQRLQSMYGTPQLPNSTFSEMC